MAFLKNNLTFFFLCALVAVAVGQKSQGGPHNPQGGPHESQGGPYTSQGGPHENQGRARRQAIQAEDDGNWIGGPSWTECDFTVNPKISCNDCNTRVICKPVGGFLIPCTNPFRPFCNNGICSSVPASGC